MRAFFFIFLLYPLFAFAQSPAEQEELALLALSIKAPAPKNAATLKKSFTETAEALLLVAPKPADSLDNLIFLFGCSAADPGCLQKVAGSLKVRYLLFAEAASLAPDNTTITFSLFDNKSQKILSTAEAQLSSFQDQESVERGLRALLKSAKLSTLAQPAPELPGPATLIEAPAPKWWIPAAMLAASIGVGALSLKELDSSVETSGERLQAQIFSVSSDLLFVSAGLTTLKLLRQKKKQKKSLEDAIGATP